MTSLGRLSFQCGDTLLSPSTPSCRTIRAQCPDLASDKPLATGQLTSSSSSSDPQPHIDSETAAGQPIPHPSV